MNSYEKMKEDLTVAVVMAYENGKSVEDALYDAQEFYMTEDGELPPVVQEFGQSLLDTYSHTYPKNHKNRCESDYLTYGYNRNKKVWGIIAPLFKLFSVRMV